MSTNVARVRVDANYQLHKWKQSDSKFTLPLQDKMDVRKAENTQNLCFCSRRAEQLGPSAVSVLVNNHFGNTVAAKLINYPPLPMYNLKK